MGHATGEVVARSTLGMSLAHDTQKIWLDDVRCAEGSNHWTGSPPTGLQHCYHAGWALHNCAADHSEDVHLQCTGELSEPATETQEEPEEPDPLTAQIEDVPATHDGTNPFTFRLVLNDEIDNAEADVRDDTFAVSGGTVTDATRVNGRGDRWEITITPDGTGNITIELAANRACGTAGAPCTADGRMLTTTALALVGGPPATPQPTQGRNAIAHRPIREHARRAQRHRHLPFSAGVQRRDLRRIGGAQQEPGSRQCARRHRRLRQGRPTDQKNQLRRLLDQGTPRRPRRGHHHPGPARHLHRREPHLHAGRAAVVEHDQRNRCQAPRACRSPTPPPTRDRTQSSTS